MDGAADVRPISLGDCAGELWECALDLLRRALEGECPLEDSLWTPVPAAYWVLSLREIQNSTLEDRRFALHLRDQTEEERLRRDFELNESMARSGLLLAGAAHQAKNLLFGLSATLESFQAVHAGIVDRHDAHLLNLREGLTRMEMMIRNIFEQGRPSEERERVAISTIVNEAIRGCSQLALAKRVNVCTAIPPDVQLCGALQPLIRALENVIDNAVRHSPKGSTVTVDVDASPDRNWLRIAVGDCGAGFQSGDLAKLGMPFYSRRAGGTGLGLTVTRKIIEEHSGKLRFTNRTCGGGLVTMLLPPAGMSLDALSTCPEAN
jgi:signal transduction histidine kinase